MIRNEDNKFILETPFFRRELETGAFGLRTNSFRNLVSGAEYLYLLSNGNLSTTVRFDPFL